MHQTTPLLNHGEHQNIAKEALRFMKREDLERCEALAAAARILRKSLSPEDLALAKKCLKKCTRQLVGMVTNVMLDHMAPKKGHPKSFDASFQIAISHNGIKPDQCPKLLAHLKERCRDEIPFPQTAV